jgi:DNA-binding XRE family transcriptional regulator
MQNLITQVFTHTNFYEQLIRDLRKAVAIVIICSPYITPGRLKALMLDLQVCVQRGVRVCVFAKKETRRAGESFDDSQFQMAVNQLVQAGVHVTLREKLHEKLCIIDNHIMWEGSLNALSHYETTERMRRWTSKEETLAAIKLHRLDECDACRPSYSTKDESMAVKLNKFGGALAQARQAKGISQIELAKLTGISQRIISAIENGQDARVSTILRLCTHIDVDVCLVRSILLPALADLDRKLP